MSSGTTRYSPLGTGLAAEPAGVRPGAANDEELVWPAGDHGTWSPVLPKRTRTIPSLPLRVATGGRPRSNVFLLDGTNIMDTNNEVPRSASGVQLGSDTVYQVQVVSTTVPAEYGRGSGGILNSITRSPASAFSAKPWCRMK